MSADPQQTATPVPSAPPVVDEVRALLAAVRKAGLKEYWELTPAEARAAHEAQARRVAPAPRPMREVVELSAPGPAGPVPIRLYRPHGSQLPAPMLVWLHGGGHVLGSLDSYDPLCRELAAMARCTVASVDYRLAPEHKFPAAVDDSFAALAWLCGRAAELDADPRRIAIGGDSAGGNLAAVCTILARDAGGPTVRFQLLVYPATAPNCDSTSHRLFAEDHLLTRKVVDWFQGHYRRDDRDRDDFRYAPLLAPSLAALPPARLILAECDPLRDEGIAYADRLRDSGVPVVVSCYPGAIHPFFSLSGALDIGRRAVQEAAASLREVFSRPA